MPRVNRQSLLQLLDNNVCEITFVKRTTGEVRTMLCTNDQSLLNSVNGRSTLNYKPPVKLPDYAPGPKNLVLTWDVFMQDWRMVNMDACNLIKSIPREEFWEYFNANVYTMTTEQKQQFMGK